MSRFIPWLLFLLVFSVGVILAPHIGPSWDEPDNIASGGQYVKFFQTMDPTILSSLDLHVSVFSDRIYSQEPSIVRYPPVPNYIGTIIALIGQRYGVVTSAHDIIVAFHWTAAIFFSLLVAYTYCFGRFFGLSIPLSIFTAFCTFLYPMLFGHGYSNTKDIAQASMFLVSLYYLMREKYVYGGIAWGLGLATKFNAVYVPIIWGIWRIFILKKRPSFIPMIGLFIAIAVWPYLWFDPAGRIGEVIRYFTTVGQGYRLFWNGVLYQVGVGQVLWWYPWASLLVNTPLIFLVIGVIGVVRVIREKKSERKILLIWLVLPMLRAILPNAAFYDGLRHFLETLPAVMLLAGIGIQELWRFGKWGKLGVMSIVLAQLLFINATYFPFSTGYYNVLAQHPNERFDRDIEALSIKEAVEFLHEKYGSFSLFCHIGGHLAWHYMTPQDQYLYPKDADSIIVVNKLSHPIVADFAQLLENSFELVHTIERGDMILARVYRRK